MTPEKGVHLHLSEGLKPGVTAEEIRADIVMFGRLIENEEELRTFIAKGWHRTEMQKVYQSLPAKLRRAVQKGQKVHVSLKTMPEILPENLEEARTSLNNRIAFLEYTLGTMEI